MIALVVSVGIVGISTVGVINFSANMTHGIPDQTADRKADVLAVSLAEKILGMPGHGWVKNGNGCLGSQLDAEGVSVYGLRVEVACAGVNGRENTLSYEKLMLSGGNAMESSPVDGNVNYADARKSLGLEGAGLNFRVSTEPFDEELDLRVLYMGHFVVGGSVAAGAGATITTSISTSLPPLPTSTTTPTISVPIGVSGPCIDCDGASTIPIACFAADYCFNLPGLVKRSIIEREFFCALTDAACLALQAEALVTAGVYAQANGPFDPAISTEREAEYLHTLLPQFEVATPQYLYSGLKMPYSVTGDVIADQSASIDSALFNALTNINDFGMDASRLRTTTSQYNVMVVGSEVVDYAFGSWSYQGLPTPSWLTGTPSVPTPTPDDPTLEGYAAQKWGSAANLVYDWVDAGGYLIVLGNENKLDWPEVKFKAKYANNNANAADVEIPVPEDALLTTPNDLDWADYSLPDDPGQAWTWKVLEDSTYERVVKRTTPKFGDVIRSVPGAFGDGSVVFTTWRPYDLVKNAPACTPPYSVESCESVRMFQNFLEGMSERFDYSFGPEVPTGSGAAVGSVQRIMSLMSQDGIRTMVKVRVHAWAGSFTALTKHTFPFTVKQDPYPTTFDVTKKFDLSAPKGTARFHLDSVPVGITWKVHMKVNWPGGGQEWDWSLADTVDRTPPETVEGGWHIETTIARDTAASGLVKFTGTLSPT